MASDMLVALARATADGHALFGHNNDRPAGEPQALDLTPGRAFAPGEKVRATHTELPQARHTWAVLGGRSGSEWGYWHGVNEKGVAAGVTPIHTRPGPREDGLTGPDLVRLALERGGSASQAVEVVTDLIARHGQQAEAGCDCALVVADAREAYVVEACGEHWALQMVPGVRAVSNACHLRQDWDRISRGLADLAIESGWWPGNGSKLDFAGALGRQGPDHAAALRRWGQATLQLEQHSGRITVGLLRRLLAEVPAVGLSVGAEEPGPASSLVVQVSADVRQVPLAWCAFGAPAASVYFPVVLGRELPPAFLDDAGEGSPLWQQLRRWQVEARRDPLLRDVLRGGLDRLQQRFDQDAHEFLAEAADLKGRGAVEELQALAGSFMLHELECFESLVVDVRSHGPEARPGPMHASRPEEELEEQMSNF
jgi:secernin